jgi:heterodisulfide reductase subunit A
MPRQSRHASERHRGASKYMCSEPGQDMIIKDIKEQQLNRVVVASCSPRMHEPTFRRTAEEGGINPYLCEMANIREHCSWITKNKPAGTAQAKTLISGLLPRGRQELTRRGAGDASLMVVGGSIAGIRRR